MVFYILLSFILLLVSGAGFLIYNKNDIAAKLLLHVNQAQQGELTFSKLNFTPFAHFPRISIHLDSVCYFENKLPHHPDTILFAEHVYAAVNVMDLIKGKISVSGILIENIKLKIVKNGEGEFNFSKALAQKTPSNDEGNKSKSRYDTEKFSVSIIDFELINSQITYQDKKENLYSSFLIQNLKSSFNYSDSLVNSSLNLSMEINDLHLADHFHLNNHEVEFESDLSYNISTEQLILNNCFLSFDKADFDLKGNVGLKGEGMMDLTVEGKSSGMGLFNILLSERGINSYEEGDVDFSGTIRGSFKNELPLFAFNFGLNKLKMKIPGSSEYIEDGMLKGSFYSGKRRDFSHSALKIDTLKAKLPGGQVNARISVENFVEPQIDLLVNIKAKVDKLDQLFKINLIDSLRGNVEIHSRLKGIYGSSVEESFIGMSKSGIVLDSLSFLIPNTMFVSLLNGELTINSDTLNLENVVFKSGETDIRLNGFIDNWLYLLLKKDKKITANLNLSSALYDLPGFFANKPNIGKGFPYKIKNINLELVATTSVFQLLYPNNTPEIDFNINNLDATIVDFLAPVKITSGLFSLGNLDQGLYLNFQDFQLQLGGSELKTHVEYFSGQADSSYVKINLLSKNLIPGKVLYYQSKEKSPELLDGILNGSFSVILNLSGNSYNFKSINFSSSNLSYYMPKDTLQSELLSLNGNNVNYNLDENSDPMSTISAQCHLSAKYIKNAALTLNNIELDLNMLNGIIKVGLKKIKIFDEYGEGQFVLNPFAKIPSYQLNYSVNQFDIQPIMSHFIKDTIISGKADFNMNVSLQGNNWENALQEFNGEISFYGKNLTVYGYDADKLIGKLKKSENFNLIDVGAVLLAGPVGLAVTKGSEYTSLLIHKSTATSQIQECISDWTIQKGVLTASDVAFTTVKNRIAAKGTLDLNSDSLHISVAVLNKKGCSEISQDLHGKIQDPKISTLKVAQSFVEPVINLVDVHQRFDCEPFYKGSLMQPEKK